MPQLCKNLQLQRPTVSHFITLLESAHLIYRLKPFGYGKEILRGRPKIYLADPAIGPSVLLKGRTLLEDAGATGRAVETAFFRHVFARYYRESIGFTYWREKENLEVDIIAEVRGTLVPFEVKYRGSGQTTARELKGIIQFCSERKLERGYVVTREPTDFEVLKLENKGREVKLLKIPAPLACYWLGRSEVEGGD